MTHLEFRKKNNLFHCKLNSAAQLTRAACGFAPSCVIVMISSLVTEHKHTTQKQLT